MLVGKVFELDSVITGCLVQRFLNAASYSRQRSLLW